MKNKVVSLVIALMLSVSFSFGQTESKNRDVFCQIIVQQKFLSKKMQMWIDYGEESKWFADKRVRDEQSGKVKSFNSQVDALNYMSEEGWTYVNSFVVTQTTSFGTTVQFYYLLKREIPIEE